MVTPERGRAGESWPDGAPCAHCGLGRYRPATKAKVAECGGRIAVVTDVPVLGCDACGDAMYEERVSSRLDELLDRMLLDNQTAVNAYTPGLPPEVTGVRPLHDYVVEVAFADGTVREFGFAGKLWGPVFAPLRDDYELFRSVRVDPELGTVVWPVGDDGARWPDWAPEELYRHSRAPDEDASYRQIGQEEDADRPLRSMRGRPRRLPGARGALDRDATRPDLIERTDVVLDADLTPRTTTTMATRSRRSTTSPPSAVYPGARVARRANRRQPDGGGAAYPADRDTGWAAEGGRDLRDKPG